MKASRAAVKTAKGLDELANEVAEMREQLNRIEDMLNELAHPLIEYEALPEDPAKPAAKTASKSSKKGG